MIAQAHALTHVLLFLITEFEICFCATKVERQPQLGRSVIGWLLVGCLLAMWLIAGDVVVMWLVAGDEVGCWSF